jgi:hypothetical protein
LTVNIDFLSVRGGLAGFCWFCNCSDGFYGSY